MAKKTFWKVWLRRNLLTQDVENDFIAEVSTTGDTLRNDGIAARIVAGRSELRLETILSILTARDEIVRDAIAQGAPVLDGCVRIAPRVSGSWLGASHVFDPTRHKIGIEVSPSGEMRVVLETVGVDVLGEKNSGAYIGGVTTSSTGKPDGIIISGDDVIVTGDKLKIAPEDDETLGAFFVDADGAETRVTHRFTENTPKKLIFRVPELAAGTWTLKVVTRFTSSSHLLNEPRVIVYEFPLTVEPAPAP